MSISFLRNCSFVFQNHLNKWNSLLPVTCTVWDQASSFYFLSLPDLCAKLDAELWPVPKELKLTLTCSITSFHILTARNTIVIPSPFSRPYSVWNIGIPQQHRSYLPLQMKPSELWAGDTQTTSLHIMPSGPGFLFTELYFIQVVRDTSSFMGCTFLLDAQDCLHKKLFNE